MASIFKKLISRELGEMNYNRYFFCYQKAITNKTSNSKEIYNDMYDKLKDKDLRAIKRMHDRLNDAMLLALHISKTYLFTFLFYIGAVAFTLSIGVRPLLTIVGLVAMSVCFLFKTYEFIVNKYCFIDAQILLVYKAVLDELITDKKLRKGK